MHRFVIVLLCILISLSLMLNACDKNSGNTSSSIESAIGDSSESTAKESSSSTEQPVMTSVPETSVEATPEASPPSVENTEQKNLKPVIIDHNEILSRLTEGNGVTVDIYGEEKIELNYHGWPTVCKGEDGTLYAVASLRLTHVDPFGIADDAYGTSTKWKP